MARTTVAQLADRLGRLEERIDTLLLLVGALTIATNPGTRRIPDEQIRAITSALEAYVDAPTPANRLDVFETIHAALSAE